MTDDILQYYPKVRSLAWSWYSKVRVGRNASWGLEDLIQEGLLSLWKCKKRFRSVGGSKLWDYAKIRVNYAMVDFLRRRSSMVRLQPHQIRKLKEYKNEFSKLRQKIQREPTDEEMAGELGLSIDEIQDLKQLDLIIIDIDDIIQVDSYTPLDEFMKKKTPQRHSGLHVRSSER